jgi:hypothetical protein
MLHETLIPTWPAMSRARHAPCAGKCWTTAFTAQSCHHATSTCLARQESTQGL